MVSEDVSQPRFGTIVLTRAPWAAGPKAPDLVLIFELIAGMRL